VKGVIYVSKVEIYNQLMAECSKDDPDIPKITFLTGMVHALRLFDDFSVPEIELPFQFVEKGMGRSELSCLLDRLLSPVL
jgi:hypothetical protein